MSIIEKLDQLAEYQAQRDAANLAKQELIDAVYTPEIRQAIADIEAEFTLKNMVVDEKIADTEAEIKAELLDLGEIPIEQRKGKYFMAVYVKGKTTWDGKKLDGMMSIIPALKDARKVGDPSVTIRRV
jgi:hypothetical protein